MDIKHIYAGGRIVKAIGEASDRNGVPIGRVEGYLASWKLEPGEYPDRIEPGAFAETITDHRRRNNRQVRLNYMHRRAPIGGFPIETVKEDPRGLFGVAEINLDTQVGREAYSLAKQDVLVDFSVGITALDRRFETTDDGIEVRVISKARLWEASLVDEPMNPNAQVTAVKAAMPFANLPAAPEDTEWDPEGALERVLDLKLRDADPTAAFLDRGRRWQIADVIDGKLMVVRGAVERVLEDVKANGVEDDALLQHLDRYCGRMGLGSPYPDPETEKTADLEIVKAWGPRDVENALAETGRFTRSAAKFLASKMAAPVADLEEPVWSKVMEELQGLKTALRAPS